VFYGGKIQNFPKLYGEFIAMGKNARQSSLVDIVSATYKIPTNKLTHSDHRSFSFEVAAEDKVYDTTPKCVPKCVGNMFSTKV